LSIEPLNLNLHIKTFFIMISISVIKTIDLELTNLESFCKIDKELKKKWNHDIPMIYVFLRP